MKRLRSILRKLLFTHNTIRYRVEWPRLADAFRKVPKPETLFDGGAGSGEFLRKALEAGFAEKVVALEYDATNFLRLQENLGAEPRATLVRGSLLEVPFPDASMDMVMTTQVIEHIEDHERAASELVRVLKPGGYALVTVPHPPEPFPNDGHVREGYTEAELRALFEPLGMNLRATDYFLTRATTNRIIRAFALPMHGVFVPVAWVDRETGKTREEREADLPFGILALFQKNVG